MQRFPFQLAFEAGPAGGDLEAMRARLLEQVMWIMGLGLTLALGGGLHKALSLGLDPAWLPQAGCMLGFLGVLVWGRGMPPRRRALILLALLWCTVAISVLRLGPVADSRGYLLVLVFLAMVFLGERAGWASLGLLVLLLGGMALGVDSGLIRFSIDLERYAQLPVTCWCCTPAAATTASTCAGAPAR